MSSYYILDTEAEANTCKSEVDAKFKEDNRYRDCYDEDGNVIGQEECTAWLATTDFYYELGTRLTDGKHIFLVYSGYDNPNNYPIEDSDPSWFPEEEE